MIIPDHKRSSIHEPLGCVLCGQKCDLEVEVENNLIVKIKGDQ